MTAPLPLLLSQPAGQRSCRSQRWWGEKGAKESKPRGAPGQRWVLPVPGQEQAGPGDEAGRGDAGRMRGCRQPGHTESPARACLLHLLLNHFMYTTTEVSLIT